MKERKYKYDIYLVNYDRCPIVTCKGILKVVGFKKKDGICHDILLCKKCGRHMEGTNVR